MRLTKGRTIGFHLLGWSLFFSLIIAFISSSQELGNDFTILTSSFLLFALVYLSLFYLNAAVLFPQLYLQKRYFSYFLVILALMAAVYFLQPFDRLISFEANGLPPRNLSPPGRPMPPPRNFPRPPMNGRTPERGAHELDIVSIILFITVWSASSVLQVFQQWRTTERRALQAEADKVSAELSFLKAQVNPHFLFNTLNNIYSLAIVKSNDTPAAILRLSGILRYITDEVRADVVPLQSEVDCAYNYIELQKLRLSKKVTVDFDVDGPVNEKTVPPLLLMTFIENAFKYGISSRQDCTITIKITAAEKGLAFFCRNKMLQTETESREGLGINNAKKRLAYLYPDKYLLNIDTQNGNFTVDLTITT